jgi:hypothetical protein
VLDLVMNSGGQTERLMNASMLPSFCEGMPCLTLECVLDFIGTWHVDSISN